MTASSSFSSSGVHLPPSRTTRLGASLLLGVGLALLWPVGTAHADVADDSGCGCSDETDSYGWGGGGGEAPDGGGGGAGGSGGAGGAGGASATSTATGSTATGSTGSGSAVDRRATARARSRTAHAACPQKPLQHDRGAWPAMLTFGAAASVVALRSVRRRPR